MSLFTGTSCYSRRLRPGSLEDVAAAFSLGVPA